MPPRAIAAGERPARLAPSQVTAPRAVGTRPEMALNKVVLPGAVQADDGDELAGADVDRHVFQRLRFAVEDADILHLQERGGVDGDGGAAGGDFDPAAHIDLADFRIAHHLVGGAFGDRLAQIHGQSPVDEGGNAFDVMVDEEDGAAFLAEAGDQFGEGADFAGGEAGEGLVHQHHFGVAGDGAGEFQAAQVGEGQGGGAAVQHGAEADALGDDAGLSVDGRVGEQLQQCVWQQSELDVFQHGLAVQRAGVLEYDADALAGDAVAGPAGDVDAVDQHLAGIGLFDPHDQLHHGGFAAAIRADQPQDLAGSDGERHVLDRDQSAEALAQPSHGQAERLRPGTGLAGEGIEQSDVHPRCLIAAPNSPAGRNRITTKATAETTKVLSSPSGRRTSPKAISTTAPIAAPTMVRRPPMTAAMITCTPTAMSIKVPGEAVPS